ncbi:MAG: DUF58 domain-containing protein [Bifidobacteriaceae bacterium]|jgi:uncharacterized protein (DUF58 family)|nr:DUF58 domain-containing protein [Bifidobacteriaceae bacterium]
MTRRGGRLQAIQTLLELHSHRQARSVLDGDYASVFRGRGTEFEDLREYVAGDSVSDIDWKATARAGKPLIRRYLPEHKNYLLLLVGTGRSMTAVAPDGTMKLALALDVAGVFANLALRHRDVVGAVFGDAGGLEAIQPRGSRAHVEYLLQRLSDSAIDPDGPESDLPAVLDLAVRSRLPHGIVILITDDADLGPSGERSLALLHARHQIMVVRIADMNLADSQAVDPFDVETGLMVPDEVRFHPRLRAQAATMTSYRAQMIERTLAMRGIAHGRVTGQDDLVETLIGLLERHRHAGR